MQTYADSETAIDFLYNLYQLQLPDETVTTDHIDVALVELTVTSFLRTIRTPNRLDLKTLKRKSNLLAVLHHVARKRNGQVVTQTFLRCQCGFLTAVLDTEEQFVALLTVLTHQRADVLHRRRLNLLEAVQGEHRFDGVEDIIATRHLDLSEVSRPLWYTWFLCHIL